MKSVFAGRFKTMKTKDGFRFRFYCDLCSFCVETQEIKNKSYEASLAQAQEEARKYFNMCHTCGKWICDEHYNEDEMNCIICSPKENRSKPKFTATAVNICPSCGTVNKNSNCFCYRCGKNLNKIYFGGKVK